MIHSHDRSGWFGASDTHYIVGNWNTKTFEKWWLEKLGAARTEFSNRYTAAGTYYEHAILDSLGIPLRKDAQIKIRKYRLRVNLDGDTSEAVYEVKTHKADKPFRITKAYYGQIQVEMFAKRCRHGYFVAYGLCEEDYGNYFNPIDKSRLQIITVDYDEDWIFGVYLPRLKYLSKCLKKGVFPRGTDGKDT